MSGAGDTITPMIISLVTTVAIRVPLAYTIAHFTKSETLPAGSPDSLFISLLISWVIGALLSCFFYCQGFFIFSLKPKPPEHLILTQRGVLSS